MAAPGLIYQDLDIVGFFKHVEPCAENGIRQWPGLLEDRQRLPRHPRRKAASSAVAPLQVSLVDARNERLRVAHLRGKPIVGGAGVAEEGREQVVFHVAAGGVVPAIV